VLESSTFHLGPLTSPQTDFAKMGRFGVRVLATVLLCGGSWVAGQDLGSGSASGGEHGTLSVSVCVCVWSNKSEGRCVLEGSSSRDYHRRGEGKSRICVLSAL
jgi:hypothetical protein